ncbi:hypothetical protein CNYM01_00236 [Colletotrichum nymphaeae SA-01]|uniref:Uncharacterized protein n=1 Tax=Colletotrichum nymphaeae SA-01 TaxID=1460502 RepID=A0A135U7H7_9PEZI|nr:hypothetical protein CNYM01_00236 [Colletotrichum nymphaeae SA-01]
MGLSFISKWQSVPTQQKFAIYGLQFDAALQASSRQNQDLHLISSALADMASLPAVSTTGGIQRRDSQDSNTLPDRVLSEARGIAYYRTFEFWDEEALLVWLRDIGPYNRSHLCGITLYQLRTCPDTVTHNMVMSRIAAMLDNSPNLKKIDVVEIRYKDVIDVSKPLKLHRDGQPKLLVTEARHIAEWMFSFFRPLLCSPSFRNRGPQRLSSLLALDQHACWLYRQRAGYHASILTIEIEKEADASFSEHMELLLERSRKKNLRRRQKKLQRLR